MGDEINKLMNKNFNQPKFGDIFNKRILLQQKVVVMYIFIYIERQKKF